MPLEAFFPPILSTIASLRKFSMGAMRPLAGLFAPLCLGQACPRLWQIHPPNGVDGTAEPLPVRDLAVDLEEL
jgi:hypothetical protein